MDAIDTETLEHNGHEIKVQWFYDESQGAPWKESDGHGIISEWTRRKKCPGERVLWEDRGSFLYYDVQATMIVAQKEKWDAKPFGTGTKGQQAERAVEADYEYLRRWCSNDWCWVGYVVEIDGDDHDSVWGYCSDDMAQETKRLFAEAIAYIDAEIAEEHDAACRDITTEGSVLR